MVKIIDINLIKKEYPSTKNYTDAQILEFYLNLIPDMDYFSKSIQYFTNINLLTDKFGNTINNDNANNNNLNNKMISIVMAHRNRPDLLFFTLQSINRSKFKNIQVIIIDDRSDPDKKPKFIKNNIFPFEIILHEIVSNEINDIRNTASVYNIGFSLAKGDIIIIQNPECVHVGDVLSYINDNFNYNDYLSFPTYSSNNIRINDYILENIGDLTMSNISGKLDAINDDDKYMCFPRWYQHSEISNRNLHFCTAISKEYLDIIGGFDPAYNDGFCYEDDDLIFRIKNVLKLNVKAINTNENVGVIHMFHGRNKYVNIPNYNGDDKEILDIKQKYFVNKNLFEYTENMHNEQKINVPKICHFYWDDPKTISYLNLFTLLTFNEHNFGWRLILWMPSELSNIITWDIDCHKEKVINDEQCKIFNYIKTNIKNVTIKYINLEKIGFYNDCSEVHKSDYLRYYALNRYGGVWSDLDIFYIRPLTKIINFDFDNIIFKCITKATEYKDHNYFYTDYCYYPVGLFFSKQGSHLFKYLMNCCLENFNRDMYECIGSRMLVKIFADINVNNLFNENNIILDNEIYLPYQWYDTGALYDPAYVNYDKVTSNTVGIHWFNGHNITKQYISKLHIDKDITTNNQSYMDKLISKYLQIIKNL